jgi:hypothetical protein
MHNVRKTMTETSAKALPGPTAWPLVGAALQFDISNPQKTMLQLAEDYGKQHLISS